MFTTHTWSGLCDLLTHTNYYILRGSFTVVDVYSRTKRTNIGSVGIKARVLIFVDEFDHHCITQRCARKCYVTTIALNRVIIGISQLHGN